LALSLNENPFPPLPAVRSALIESILRASFGWPHPASIIGIGLGGS
jgi:hypothetical protein